MMNFQTILAPVDFSECSFTVAKKASALAQHHGARIVFLHVFHGPQGLDLSLRIFPDSEKGGQTLRDMMDKEATPLMEKYAEIAREANVEAVTKVVGGEIADTILKVAADVEAELIMMGTHGRTGIHRLMLGSQAERVVRLSTVPVLTIRSEHRPQCEASSCSTCRSGLTDTEWQALAEVDG